MTKAKPTFAEAMTSLEDIVQQLEQGEVPLENAIDLYKKGMELSQLCHQKLQYAEEQLVTIVDESGNTTLFDTTEEA